MGGDVITVLVVDDHAPFRAAVGVLCMADGGLAVVAEAGSVAQALDALSTDPDLVVLDVNLGGADGGVDGVEGARRIRALRPWLPVVLCSTAAPSELPAIPDDRGVTFVPKQNLDARVLHEWFEQCRPHQG